ncbi:motility quorum-sensing regulator / GCU-specific mRNA interferase toxin [Azospirillaceae bacterium]
MEKLGRTYRLEDITSAFADPAKLNRTKISLRDAAGLGMDAAAVVQVIQGLQPTDFDKSATAHHDHTRWHDSYKPTVKGRKLYLKFTLDDRGSLLLTSFKEMTE